MSNPAGERVTASELIRQLGDAAWQVCECGDWRWDHAGGGGRCHVCAASWRAPYNRCKEFRLSRVATPEEIAEAKGAIGID